jgi:SSS family solute:Na+ symporter
LNFLLLIAVYSLALIGVGLAVSRYVRSAGDFFVAGRRLSSPLIFTTFLAANIGAGSTVGATGLGYALGLSAWWWVGSAGIGSLLLALFIGPRIYRLSRRYNFYTVGDYLEHRYSPAVRGLFAGVLWLGSLAILAGQLIAVAWILNAVAGIPKPLGCAIGGGVVTAYFAAGGLFSAAWVNVIQLTVKMLGFLIAVPWALAVAGGWHAVALKVAGQQGGLGAGAEAYLGFTGIGLRGILGYAVILIPSFIVSPGLIQKLYGARDEQAVRRGVGWQAAALLAYAFLPAILGITARAALPALPNREMALPAALQQLLPSWLGALLLAAVFSAEVSASDAILFMLSTSVAKDFYQRFINPAADDGTLLVATRWTALGAGLAGIAAAILLPSVIAALTIFYGLLAVALFVPLLAGLYFAQPTARAALATMVVSLAAAAVAHIVTHGAGWSVLTPYAVGILAGAVVMALASSNYWRRLFGGRSLGTCV